MKTIISSTVNSLKSPFDLRFGRAGWFCLQYEETGKTSFKENEHRDASHGAGTRVVEKVVDLGATKVISGDFGHCSQFDMIEVENKEIKNTTFIDTPPHEPGMLPPWLAERGATDIIAGGMGQRAIQLFNDKGVNVFVGAPKLTPEELVTGFLEETLKFSANYCDH